MDYRVIKENDLFLLTDTSGNIPENHPYGLGLYTKDTRFLSKLDLKINGEEPILLSSSANENYYATIMLTNPHMERDGELILWRESVELTRTRFIHNDVCYELLKAKNYFPKPVSFELSLHVDVDFNDMFIVRGFQNGDVGERTGQVVGKQEISFAYQGADNVKRASIIRWDKDETKVTETGDVHFNLSLGHEEEETIAFMVIPSINDEMPEIVEPKVALEKLKVSTAEWKEETTQVETNNKALQRLVDRGIGDLRVLLTDLGYGKFPVAGLPWFGVPFGRDSLIAALQMLPFSPDVAKGTLKTMAAFQGTKKDAWRDEEPGKIMHEIRFGELANTGQIPFTPYYGTIDATPLFLVLLTEYVNWTRDTALFQELETNVERALEWINRYGDRDGDLFVEYHQEAEKGIANQGWKDSGDSIVHRNGEYAETPIALSEVQGYVYQAKQGIASIYEKLGKVEEATALRTEAQTLKERFEEEFWMEDVSFYALALDKDKKQVGTLTTNPGHILMSGMLNAEKAKSVSDVLVSDKMFSGYGIRTMGKGEAGYNPMSYHDGSIWPHDNSLVILGMSRTNNKEQAATVMNGLIEASHSFEYDRLPELFCGYDAKLGKAVKYPVACSPQAWAAGTPLVFVQSMVGLFPDTLNNKVYVRPFLPEGTDQIKLLNVQIGEGVLSIEVKRSSETLAVEVLENTTAQEIIIEA
ncbi:amylo-alpha-1,6-glucosidase [Anaerobacillus alkalilacustris]|uniref:Amylo-alpha-1,6-glucosidase n=1 Tax=Anaerobacillus alkalilacustris TaxID=393763 RepID=A0A1S2LX07_9BACI|nr:amylo-alpha-1,6-glucosidase [Anaerobacillus alkalilacustris]OIJ17059.1 amylo-alpha-1,6-glucosidase [Anaerobacillus alkalilacustris]